RLREPGGVRPQSTGRLLARADRLTDTVSHPAQRGVSREDAQRWDVDVDAEHVVRVPRGLDGPQPGETVLVEGRPGVGRLLVRTGGGVVPRPRAAPGQEA